MYATAQSLRLERDAAQRECAELRERLTLYPAENIALTVGLAQAERGELTNVAATCVYALARIARGAP